MSLSFYALFVYFVLPTADGAVYDHRNSRENVTSGNVRITISDLSTLLFFQILSCFGLVSFSCFRIAGDHVRPFYSPVPAPLLQEPPAIRHEAFDIDCCFAAYLLSLMNGPRPTGRCTLVWAVGPEAACLLLALCYYLFIRRGGLLLVAASF